MLVYSAEVPVLDDTFEGDTVSVLAVRAGKVDRNFLANYSWAKHAVDSGRVKRIVVVVEVDKTDWLHTKDAVVQAIGGVQLHASADFQFVASHSDYAATVREVRGAVKRFESPRQLSVVKPKARGPRESDQVPEVKEGGVS